MANIFVAAMYTLVVIVLALASVVGAWGLLSDAVKESREKAR